MRNKSGITLIALIITITVLLILAGVSISALVGDNGVVTQAQKAAKKTKIETLEEEVSMAWSSVYADYLAGSTSGGDLELENYFNQDNLNKYIKDTGRVENLVYVSDGISQLKYVSNHDNNTYRVRITSNGKVYINTYEEISMEDAQKDNMYAKTVNSYVFDEYGNKIYIPSGFKMIVNSSTNNAQDVTKGIVIGDVNGNEFVWIPVGEIKKENGTEIIELNRYVFDGSNGNPTAQDDAEIIYGSYNFNVGEVDDYFLESVQEFGGYYIGRYEAREKGNTETRTRTNSSETNEIVINSTNTVYDCIGTTNAKTLSKMMYNVGYFYTYVMNGYSWDTALLYLQKFDTRSGTNTPYSIQTGTESEFSHTGTLTDVICNVYDFGGNAKEYTTEISSYKATGRGGMGNNVASGRYPSSRWETIAFRVLLYL